jgi:hypothetical protein
MQLKSDRIRLWLYRGLVGVAAGLVVFSATQPWWIGEVSSNYIGQVGTITVYQYGLRHTFVQLRDYVVADETPFYQNMLAWIYIAISVSLILFSTRLKRGKGSWLLGSIGLIYIAYAAVAAYVVIAGRLRDFNVSLEGWSWINTAAEEVQMYSKLQFGYYLAYAAGFMCVALALLRGIIVGKPKFNTH